MRHTSFRRLTIVNGTPRNKVSHTAREPSCHLGPSPLKLITDYGHPFLAALPSIILLCLSEGGAAQPIGPFNDYQP